MYQIFSGDENKVKEWLSQNPDIEIVNTNTSYIFDRYVNTGEICNQWLEVTIIYKDKQNEQKGKEL